LPRGRWYRGVGPAVGRPARQVDATRLSSSSGRWEKHYQPMNTALRICRVSGGRKEFGWLRRARRQQPTAPYVPSRARNRLSHIDAPIIRAGNRRCATRRPGVLGLASNRRRGLTECLQMPLSSLRASDRASLRGERIAIDFDESDASSGEGSKWLRLLPGRGSATGCHISFPSGCRRCRETWSAGCRRRTRSRHRS
jgi:hypothetical protein